MQSNDFKKYQEQYINTLAPGELVTLLYNEIVKNLNKSILYINNKKIMDAHTCIVKAQDIILHLINTLDFNFSIANELLPLYEFMYDSLVKANVKKDTTIIYQIMGMVNELRDTWVEAEKQSRVNSYVLGKSV